MQRTQPKSILRSAEIFLSVTGLFTVVLLVFFSSLFRRFGTPIRWASDLAQLLFSWVVFLGADLALQAGRHQGVEILEQRLPAPVRRALSLLWNILIILFLIVGIFFGIKLFSGNTARRFNTLPISHSWMTASVPVGFLLMLKTTLENLFRLLQKKPDFSEKRD